MRAFSKSAFGEEDDAQLRPRAEGESRDRTSSILPVGNVSDLRLLRLFHLPPSNGVVRDNCGDLLAGLNHHAFTLLGV